MATITPKQIQAQEPKPKGLGLYEKILSRASKQPETTSTKLYDRLLSSAPEAATPQTLQRQFRNEAFQDLDDDPLEHLGDTTKERMALSPQAEIASEKQLDPAVIGQLMDLPDAFDDPDSITLDPSTRVFVDPAQFDAEVEKVPETGRSITFKKAFDLHRAKGDQQFDWKGSLFTTRRKDEEDSHWATILKTNKAKANKEAEKPVKGARKRPVAEPLLAFDPEGNGYDYQSARAAGFEPDETGHWQSRDPNTGLLLKGRGHATWSKTVKAEKEAGYEVYEKDGRYYSRPGRTFDARLKQSGFEVKDQSINVSGVSEKMGPAVQMLAPILQEAGIVPTVTSGLRKLGVWSLHETGDAFDIRLKDASPSAIKKLKALLPGKSYPSRADGKDGTGWSVAGWDFILHGEGNNIHLHVERETEDAKRKLAEKLKKAGLSGKISRKGLSRYPDLLEEFFPGVA